MLHRLRKESRNNSSLDFVPLSGTQHTHTHTSLVDIITTMGFYPWLQITSGFVVSPAQPYERLLRSLFPGVPTDWLHWLPGDRLLVFPRSLSHDNGGFDSTLSEEECKRGYVYWDMGAQLSTSNDAQHVLKQLNDMARSCGATVRLFAVVLVACSLDGFASRPSVDNAVPIVTSDNADTSQFRPVPPSSFAGRDWNDLGADERRWEAMEALYNKQRQEANEHCRLYGMVLYKPPNPLNQPNQPNLHPPHPVQPITQALPADSPHDPVLTSQALLPDTSVLWSIITRRATSESNNSKALSSDSSY